MKYPLIIFDFDGTLVDSAPGIINSIKYTLNELGVQEDGNVDYRRYMGPPLNASFQELLNIDDIKKIDEAVDIYRQYYARQGAYEAELYPGAKELLEILNEKGSTVCLATSKYSLMAEKMMSHFGIRHLIKHAAMAEKNQKKSKKREMILDILSRSQKMPENAVMIGDTFYDAEGAAAAGVDFIAVLYGYGLREEMEGQGASFFVETVGELRKALLP